MELTANLMDNALSLSEKDRAELAYQLLQSLKAAEPEAEVEAAWAVEVQKRLELAEKDPSRLRDLDIALDKIESSVRARRLS